MKELTRKFLEDSGITVNWSDEENNWIVMRKAVDRRSGKEHVRRVSRGAAITQHKYAGERSYPIYSFHSPYKANHTITLTESRLVYCYFISDIPKGYDVDHIDDNPWNNKLDNLQLLTHRDNLLKRTRKIWNHYQYLKEKEM